MANYHDHGKDLIDAAKSAPLAVGKYRFRISPTSALIAVNLLIFLLMWSTGTPLFKPSSEQILEWGGNYAPLTLSGQWWRLLTSIFVHIGVVHIAVNMWCLYELGGLAEELYGDWSFLALYILTGVAGSIAGVGRNVIVVTAGSSGAIFGLAGALIASLSLGRFSIPRRELIIALGSLVAFAAYNLAYGFLRGGIDNGAHVGGLICGLLAGIFLRRDLGPDAEPRRRCSVVFSATVVVLVLAFGLVRHIRGQALVIESARQDLSRGNPDLAIGKLAPLAGARHDDPTVYSILGAAYEQKRDYPKAETFFRRVLQSKPNDASATLQLASVYFNMGRLDDAQKEFAKAVELNPNDASGWVGLGVMLQRMGRHEEAAAALQRAATLNPKLVQAQFGLGISAMNLRRYDKAIAAFKKAADLDPKDATAQIWLGNAYEAAGLKKEADAAYFTASQRQRTLRRPGQLRRP
jgi:membrane associated rhomboid family serine protease/Flp pilus assembly protein TadD